MKANECSCSVHHSNFGLNEHIIPSNLIAQLVEWQTSIPKGAICYRSSIRKSLHFLYYNWIVHFSKGLYMYCTWIVHNNGVPYKELKRRRCLIHRPAGPSLSEKKTTLNMSHVYTVDRITVLRERVNTCMYSVHVWLLTAL